MKMKYCTTDSKNSNLYWWQPKNTNAASKVSAPSLEIRFKSVEDLTTSKKEQTDTQEEISEKEIREMSSIVFSNL